MRWFKDNLWPAWFWNRWYANLHEAYENGYFDGMGQPGKEYITKLVERQTNARIQARIESRVSDLRGCHKDDTCQELATVIESYIDEWLD